MIITVGREFGSGGRELAKRLADIFGYDYYDKENITPLMKNLETKENLHFDLITPSYVSTPYIIQNSFSTYPTYSRLQIKLLNIQQKLLMEIGKKGNCIIVGQGADVILKDLSPVTLFVYAEKSVKLERCRKKAHQNENFSAKQYLQKMNAIDKHRKRTYSLLGGSGWGKKENYDFLINTTNFEIKEIAPAVAQLIKILKYINQYNLNRAWQ